MASELARSVRFVRPSRKTDARCERRPTQRASREVLAGLIWPFSLSFGLYWPLTFAQAHSGPAAVLVDEFGAGHFQWLAKPHSKRRRWWPIFGFCFGAVLIYVSIMLRCPEPPRVPGWEDLGRCSFTMSFDFTKRGQNYWMGPSSVSRQRDVLDGC